MLAAQQADAASVVAAPAPAAKPKKGLVWNHEEQQELKPPSPRRPGAPSPRAGIKTLPAGTGSDLNATTEVGVLQLPKPSLKVKNSVAALPEEKPHEEAQSDDEKLVLSQSAPEGEERSERSEGEETAATAPSRGALTTKTSGALESDSDDSVDVAKVSKLGRCAVVEAQARGVAPGAQEARWSCVRACLQSKDRVRSWLHTTTAVPDIPTRTSVVVSAPTVQTCCRLRAAGQGMSLLASNWTCRLAGGRQQRA